MRGIHDPILNVIWLGDMKRNNFEQPLQAKSPAEFDHGFLDIESVVARIHERYEKMNVNSMHGPSKALAGQSPAGGIWKTQHICSQNSTSPNVLRFILPSRDKKKLTAWAILIIFHKSLFTLELHGPFRVSTIVILHLLLRPPQCLLTVVLATA